MTASVLKQDPKELFFVFGSFSDNISFLFAIDDGQKQVQ